MTNPIKGRYGIIMGDIVQSESSLPVELLYEQFNNAVEHQNVNHKADLVSPLTITLGDEFQGLVRTLSEAAMIARDLRLELLEGGIDCRFVIGFVEIKTPLNVDKAWNMMGPGLSRARRKLNDKKSNQFYRFSIEENSLVETLLDAIGAGVSLIERDWTEQQRKDIKASIEGASAADLAKLRGVSVHSIYKVRSSGDFETYSVQWRAISDAVSALDKQKRIN